MSKPVNPVAIGGFLIGGLVLLIIAILVFGGGQFFKPKIHWVVYFDTSLNGLNVGAPVKVQGVEVGLVKEIELQFDRKQQRLWKPVVLEIEPWRMASADGQPLQLSLFTGKERMEELRRLIDAGLRARLEVQSILTGLLYVDLDFHPHQPSRLTGLNYKDMPEIPSIPPTVDEVITTLEDVVKKIRGIPLEDMMADMAATLADIRKLVGSEETRKSQQALSHALADAQNILAKLDQKLPSLVNHMDRTIDSIGTASQDISKTARETSSVLKDMKDHAAPVMKTAEQTLIQASEAMASTKAAAENLSDTTANDSALQDSMAELRKAAQSLRTLTDYLQRHPDSILYGHQDRD